MKALIAIASAGIALFAATTAGAATGSDAVGRWTTPSSVDTSGRGAGVAPSGAIGRLGAIGRIGGPAPNPRLWSVVQPSPRFFVKPSTTSLGAIGRWGVIRLSAAGFRW